LHILKLTSCLALFSGFFFFQKTDCCEFYVLLTLHLGIFFVNNQLDAQFLFSCMFISILYMFRAAMCPSSGKLIVSIRHLVHVTLYRWPFSVHIKRSSVQSDIHQMSYWYN